MLHNAFAGHYSEFDLRFIPKIRKRLVKWFRSFFRGQPPVSQDRQWVEWARRLPRSAFIIWLAGHVADELIAKKSRRVSFDELIESVAEDRAGMIQNQAERFIENYYFDYEALDPHVNRAISVFRRVIKRKLLQYAKSRQT